MLHLSGTLANQAKSSYDLKYPPNQVLDTSIIYYKCSSCNRDRVTSKRFSKDNDIIPLTLVSGSTEELQECMYASHLESMLFARACNVMRVVRHINGNFIYQGRVINFLQGVFGFFRSGCIPQKINNTPYVVLLKQGYSDVIFEERARHHVVKNLSEYYIDNFSGYGRLDVESLNIFPEYGIVQDLIIFVEYIGDESTTTTAQNPIGNIDSTISIPQRQ